MRSVDGCARRPEECGIARTQSFPGYMDICGICGEGVKNVQFVNEKCGCVLCLGGMGEEPRTVIG